MSAAKNKVFHIRLSDKQARELDELQEEYGMDQSDLVRFAIGRLYQNEKARRAGITAQARQTLR